MTRREMSGDTAPGRVGRHNAALWIAAPLVIAGYVLVGAFTFEGWLAMLLNPASPSVAGEWLVLATGGVITGALGAWSLARQPRATLFVLVVGTLSIGWSLPAFPMLCAGLLAAPLLPRRSSEAKAETPADAPPARSVRTCPACGEHRLRAVTPPRIDVQGVAPWLDLYAMGDPHPTTPPAIACDGCGAGWPDLATFEAAAGPTR